MHYNLDASNLHCHELMAILNILARVLNNLKNKFKKFLIFTAIKKKKSYRQTRKSIEFIVTIKNFHIFIIVGGLGITYHLMVFTDFYLRWKNKS